MSNHNQRYDKARFPSRSLILIYLFKCHNIHYTNPACRPLMLHRISNTVSKALRRKQQIFHFKLNFPLTPSRLESCLHKLRLAQQREPSAIALSLNAASGNKSHYALLFDSFVSTSENARAPFYTFIEDYASTEGYFLACAAKSITATPFSVIGQIGVYKSYPNIKRLLDFLQISYVEFGTSTKSSYWNMFKEPRQQQKQFNQNYIRKLDENMIANIASRRPGVSTQIVESVRGKLLTPKQALELKLIDAIGTFDEFKQVNYPNHKVVEYTFQKSNYIFKLSEQETHVFSRVAHLLQMESPALLMAPGEFEEVLVSLQKTLEARIQDYEFMEYLDEEICPQLMESVTQRMQSESPINLKM